MQKLNLIQYIGAKYLLSDWIILFFPEHIHFIDAFGGSGAVILNKKQSKCTTYNDIDGDLVNLFIILSKENTFNEFYSRIECLPYYRYLFDKCKSKLKDRNFDDDIDRAVCKYIIHRQSFGGKGLFWGCSHVNKKQPQSFYCAKDYKYNMSKEQHIQFINMILNIKGMIVVSGYQGDIYDVLEKKGWNIFTKECRTFNHQTTKKKVIETIWVNPLCMEKLKCQRETLFQERI
jgi:site-specific DNA-adenine methylase